MAYLANNDILDDHYNDFAVGNIGGTIDHNTRNLDTIWGTGTGDKGYGQGSLLGSVGPGTNVTATQWATMLDRMDAIAAHQGTTITHPTNPTVGNNIAVFGQVDTDITNMFTNRLNASANAVDSTTTMSASGTWNVSTQHYQTITWASANHARYFFNAGGQIRISFARSGGQTHTKNTEWTDLCTKCGTLVFGANTFTKSGGSGVVTTLNNNGWYNITSTFNVNFKQFADSSPYTSNFITVETAWAATNTQLLIRVIYQDAAADNSIPSTLDNVDGTVTTTFVERPPSTAQLANTWGNPTNSATSNVQT